MKKSSFVAFILGTFSVIFFSLGMCMVLIAEWNAFQMGILLGGIGIILAFITLMIWRRMENKKPIHVTIKSVVTVTVGVIGALMLGVGMCFSMVWQEMVIGIVIGLIGILVLLCLIPLIKGIQK